MKHKVNNKGRIKRTVGPGFTCKGLGPGQELYLFIYFSRKEIQNQFPVGEKKELNDIWGF